MAMEGRKQQQPLLLLLLLPPGSSGSSQGQRQVDRPTGHGGRLSVEQVRSYFQSTAGEVEEISLARSGRNGSIRFRRAEGTQRALKQGQDTVQHSIDGTLVSVSLPFEMRMQSALSPLKQIVGDNDRFFQRSGNNLPCGADSSILYLNVRRLRELPAATRSSNAASHAYVRVRVGEKEQLMKLRIKTAWINPVFTFNESAHFELHADGEQNDALRKLNRENHH
eukprot:750600-Hanusia_phi.AAC.4